MNETREVGPGNRANAEKFKNKTKQCSQKIKITTKNEGMENLFLNLFLSKSLAIE